MCASASRREGPLRVLVFLGVGADTRIPPECDPRSGRVREERLVREIDPDSARALDLALRLKELDRPTEVTVIHFGPEDRAPWLRRALALGADRAVRVWDGDAARARTAGRAVILAAAAEVAGFDLVLAGAKGAVDSGGRLGVLAAAHLGVPCVTQVVDIVAERSESVLPDREGPGEEDRPQDQDRPGDQVHLELVRGLDRGFRERAEVLLPAVATVSSAEGFAGPLTGAAAAPAVVTAGALLAAQAREITVWDLADLGVPLEKVRDADRSLSYGRPRPPRPRLRPIAAPDPTLPAFDRILKLIEGSVKRREGRIVRESPDATVAEILRTLQEEGWLDHLRPEAGPRR